MRIRVLLVSSLALAALTLALACGSSSDPSGSPPSAAPDGGTKGDGSAPGPIDPPLEPGPRAEEFGDRYCALTRPCCEAAGAALDPAKCHDLTNFGMFSTQRYVPSRAEACLAALAEVVARAPACS